MGIIFDVVRAAAGSGNQDFTGDLGGLTAKAAIFIGTYATADATAAPDAVLSFGAATGASERWCLSSGNEDGQANTDTQGSANDDQVIRFNTPGTATVDGEADFVEFITNGVRVNWGNAPASAYLIKVVLIAGSDLSAHAGNAALGNSTDNVVDVTGPGFQQDCTICGTIDGLAAGENSNTCNFSTGIVDSSFSQRVAAIRWANSRPAGAPEGRCSASYGAMSTDSSGNLDWGGEFSENANGFTVTTRNAGANTTSLFYLALNFRGAVSAKVVTHSTPTSEGEESQSGIGFSPQFVHQIMTYMEAVDTAYDFSALAGSHGFSDFNDTNEFADSVQTEAQAATTDTQSFSDDIAVNLPEDDGTTGIEGSFASMTSDGWVIDYTAVTGNAKLFFSLAIEKASKRIFITHT